MMEKILEEKLFIGFWLILTVLAAGVIGYSVWSQSRWGQAQRYEQLSNNLPPSSLQAKRYRAMAKALREGRNYYYFTANRIPAVGGQ